jgi:type VI secretion system protein ImpF
MAQLSLRERLQPALFDRLIDDERVLTCYEFAFRRDELTRLGIKERELASILTAQGLREVEDGFSFDVNDARPEAPPMGDEPARSGAPASASERASGRAPVGADDRASGGAPLSAADKASGGTAPPRAHQTQPVNAADLFRLTLVAPGGKVSPSSLKTLQLKPPGAPKGVALQTFCEITVRNVVNTSPEGAESRALSTRRLREYVCRDLAALLNSACLDAVVDLSNHEHVQASVINFGMPSLAGRSARSADPQQIAATIQSAVQRFEPRLSHVRVTPEMGEEGNETHVLAFRIDAQLWGQPMPQQLVLRTSIDIDSGNVSLAESGLG